MSLTYMPSIETIKTVHNKIFIVSLPRTGTKSLTKMLMTLGYKASHCPSIRLEWEFQANIIEVFADTPIYRPSLFLELAKDPTNKFIYIDRNPKEWLASFEAQKLNASYLSYLTMPEETIHRVSRLDRDSLVEIFKQPEYSSELAEFSFYEHSHLVESIPSDQLLVYKFSDGWKPLCDFLGKDIPDADIPHINKDTLFEKIV